VLLARTLMILMVILRNVGICATRSAKEFTNTVGFQQQSMGFGYGDGSRTTKKFPYLYGLYARNQWVALR
jgi:hypothetical protein